MVRGRSSSVGRPVKRSTRGKASRSRTAKRARSVPSRRRSRSRSRTRSRSVSRGKKRVRSRSVGRVVKRATKKVKRTVKKKAKEFVRTIANAPDNARHMYMHARDSYEKTAKSIHKHAELTKKVAQFIEDSAALASTKLAEVDTALVSLGQPELAAPVAVATVVSKLIEETAAVTGGVAGRVSQFTKVEAQAESIAKDRMEHPVVSADLPVEGSLSKAMIPYTPPGPTQKIRTAGGKYMKVEM